jgi:hypothetical protein
VVTLLDIKAVVEIEVTQSQFVVFVVTLPDIKAVVEIEVTR